MKKVWDFQTGKPFKDGHRSFLDEPMPANLATSHIVPCTVTPWAVTITFRDNIESALRDTRMRNEFREHFSTFKEFYAILYSEWSPPPEFRLHYHGTVYCTFRQMVRFKEKCFKHYGSIKIKEVFILQDWLTYCTKENDEVKRLYQTRFSPIVLCNLKRKIPEKENEGKINI